MLELGKRHVIHVCSGIMIMVSMMEAVNVLYEPQDL